MAQRVHNLVEAMRRLARRSAVSSLRRTVEKSRAEDIAEAIGHLAPHEQKLVDFELDEVVDTPGPDANRFRLQPAEPLRVTTLANLTNCLVVYP